MLQVVQTETQAEQQSLTLLRMQRAARRTSRKLALHRTEQAFDQRSAPVEALRERPPHLRAHSVDAPRFHSALGGDHALRPELLPDVGMIPRTSRKRKTNSISPSSFATTFATSKRKTKSRAL